MVAQLFEVSTGLSIDGAIQILYGTGLPSADPIASVAPKGSSFTDTATGKTYTRTGTAGTASDWSAEAREEAAIIVQNVGSTYVLLDKIPVGMTDAFEWEITAHDNNTSNKTSFTLHATHNATDVAMATTVKHSISNKIAQGTKIPGLMAEARLTAGAADRAAQFLEVWGSAIAASKFTLVRRIKNYAGSDVVAASSGAAAAAPARNLGYDIAGWSAGVVVQNDVLLKVVVPRPVTLPANMLGSFAACVYAPSAPTSFSLQKNGVEFNTLSFAMGAVSGAFGTSAEQNLVAGDILTLVVNNSDATMSGVATSLVGNIIDTQALDVFMWAPSAPVAGQIVHLSMMPRTFYFAPNLAGSVARCATAPTAEVVYSIQRNGVQINSCTFAAGSTVGVFGTSAAEVLSPGSVLAVLPLSSDATLTDMTMTLAGSVPA